MKPQKPPKAYSENEVVRLVWLAIFVSVFSFLYYYRHGDVLLYGDAVAHINIARRVFDSKTPGLLQLGTVWLPLPHLVMVPFLFSDAAWQTGIAGAIPSMVAYVLGTVGVFRLVLGALSNNAKPGSGARVAAWLAAAIYAGMLAYRRFPDDLFVSSEGRVDSLRRAIRPEPVSGPDP